MEGLVAGKPVCGALRHGRKGRHGIGARRAAFDAFAIDGARPDSELERVMSALLAANDLPAAVFHPRILGDEIDFPYLEEKVILECDGWANRGRDRRQFERDRERDAALIAAGWVILHFRWAQIIRRPRGSPDPSDGARRAVQCSVTGFWREIVAGPATDPRQKPEDPRAGGRRRQSPSPPVAGRAASGAAAASGQRPSHCS